MSSLFLWGLRLLVWFSLGIFASFLDTFFFFCPCFFFFFFFTQEAVVSLLFEKEPLNFDRDKSSAAEDTCHSLLP